MGALSAALTSLHSPGLDLERRQPVPGLPTALIAVLCSLSRRSRSQLSQAGSI